MKNLLFALPILFLFSFLALAQEAPPLPANPDQEFFMMMAQIFTMKGAGTLVIVALAVQILIKFLSTSLFGALFSQVNGVVKLLIVTGLSIVGSVVGLMSPPTSLSFLSALTSGAILSALMVYGNQLYQHFFPPKT